jgi:hypothetical protein
MTLADARQRETEAWMAMVAAEKRLHQSELWKEYAKREDEWFAAHQLVAAMRLANNREAPSK